MMYKEGKQEFIAPEAEVLLFETMDVITASGTGEDGGDVELPIV